MSFTRADLRADLQAHGFGVDSAAAQNLMIASTLRRLWGLYPWRFLRAQASLTLAKGASTLTAPAGRVTSVIVVLPDGETQSLNFLPWEQFTRNTEEVVEDLPEVWTISTGGLIHVWPDADRSYTVLVRTITEPAAPADDVTAINWPDVYRDVILMHVLVHMALRQRDLGAAQVFKQAADERTTEMLRTYNLEQQGTSREVARWDGWDETLWP